jgi:hypothetical protein
LIALIAGCASQRAVSPKDSLVGKKLPEFVGDSLDGRQLNFPSDITGKPVLLLVAYLQESQFDVDRWVLGLLQSQLKLKVLELPTIEGLGARLAKSFINRGMKQGIPEQDWPAVVTVYGDAEKLGSFVGGIRGNNSCAILLDGDAVVRWIHCDGYSPRELIEMGEVLKGLS